MRRFGEEAVAKLAGLAQLSLTDSEKESFSGQLEAILGYAERIESLDTEGVAPTSHALLREGRGDAAGSLRDDAVTESLERSEVLEGAPDNGDGLFKVPKVLP